MTSIASKMSKMQSVRQKSTARSAMDGGEFYRPQPKRGSKLSLLRRKRKKSAAPEGDCTSALESMEVYKDSADKLHYALLLSLVDGRCYADKLACLKIPQKIACDPCYQYLSDYLYNYEILMKKGHKGTYESLEPAVFACRKMAEEQNKYIRRQLETITPLTKFVGDYYWEFSRLKAIYQYHLDRHESVVQNHQKQNTAESEQLEKDASREKERAKTEMLAMVNKINSKKEAVADCVLKFAKMATEWHRQASTILAPFNKILDKHEKSSVSSENSPTSKKSLRET